MRIPFSVKLEMALMEANKLAGNGQSINVVTLLLRELLAKEIGVGI